MFVVIAKCAHDNLVESVLALQTHMKVFVSAMIKQQGARAVWDDITPVGTVGRAYWCFSQFEVFRAVDVGDDEEPVPRCIMLQVIFDARFAGRHQPRLCIRCGCINKMAFAGLVIMGTDHDVATALNRTHTHEEAGVCLFINTDILCRVFPQSVAEHFAGAMVLINPHIKEGSVVERPGCATTCVRDSVCKIGP